MDNLIFIVTDSLRKDKIGVYNDEVDFTGNLDDFSEEASVFEHAVSQSCWTLPSHASMFTGLYPWEHNATHRNLELDVEKETLAEIFSEQGYDTACFSINGFLNHHSGLVSGFGSVENLGIHSRFDFLDKITGKIEEWLSGDRGFIKRKLSVLGDKVYHNIGSEMKESEKIVDKAESFIESSDDFFLFINLMDAHEPYRPPKKYKEKHEAEKSICQYPVEFYGGEEVDFEEVNRYYDASVDYMDDQIGRLFEKLKTEGEWEETVIVLVSDHGQMLGEDNHYGHQYSVHENLVSVPLIVKGVNEDRVEEQFELKELYSLVQSCTGIKQNHSYGDKIARGGIDFPDMNINRIPEERHKDLYKRKKFARKTGKKSIETENEDGSTEINTVNLKTGEIAGDEDLEDEVRDIVFSGDKGSDMKDKDEEIKEQLEALGYG